MTVNCLLVEYYSYKINYIIKRQNVKRYYSSFGPLAETIIQPSAVQLFWQISKIQK